VPRVTMPMNASKRAAEQPIESICNADLFVVGTVTHRSQSAEGTSLAKAKVAGLAVETGVDKRNRRIAEGKVAMAEYAARAAAIDKNTQRLRALRLAKDAADGAAALLNPPPDKPARKTSARKQRPG